MIRRTLIYFTALAILVMPAWVLAAEEVKVEQVRVCLPEVDVYYYEPEVLDFNLTAKLNGEELKLDSNESALKSGLSYYFLVDVSTSIRPAQMEAIKQSLSEVKIGEKDDVTLITFGLNINVLLDKETDNQKYLDTVASLLATEKGTLFFDALNSAAQLAGNSDVRRRNVACVFSDSVDVNLGGYTQAEIEKKTVENNLPVYAFGFSTGEKDKLDSFGAIARVSGGEIAIVTDKTLPDEFAAKLLSKMQDIKVAKFSAKNNVSSGSVNLLELSYYMGETPIGKRNIEVSTASFMPDNIPPKAESAVQSSDRSIQILFNEEVEGANNLNSFKISDENGNILGIAAIDYAQMCAEITLINDLQTGELTIEFPGITDNSMEKNKIEKPVKLSVIGKPEEIIAPEPTPPVQAVSEESDTPSPVIWLVIGIIFVIIIIAILIAVVKKRGGVVVHEGKIHFKDVSVEGEKQYHIENKLPKLSLQVFSTSGDSQIIDVPIKGSLFFGRSTSCDVYFDDNDMSRQHFVIEQNGEGYVLTNLSETNGTVLNDKIIDMPEILNSGDKICAGQKIIIFLGDKK